MKNRPVFFEHSYPFDPTYGYDLRDLLKVRSPKPAPGFEKFWRERYQNAIQIHPKPELIHTGGSFAGYEVYDLFYTSSDGFRIAAWILIPKRGVVTQGIIVGHGYNGREQPDYHFQFPGTVLMFPCFRGLGKSGRSYISSNPIFHVLHDIHQLDRYILGGCVEDLWLAVSALLRLFPGVRGQVGYLGTSFGGGIGALACPWDQRIDKLHLSLPAFGHNPLRMRLKTVGSANSVQQFISRGGHISEILAYYDAAVSASYGKQPLHFAAALFDPSVAPPGQFAIYNAWQGDKELHVSDAGHFDYPEKQNQERELLEQLQLFFSNEQGIS